MDTKTYNELYDDFFQKVYRALESVIYNDLTDIDVDLNLENKHAAYLFRNRFMCNEVSTMIYLMTESVLNSLNFIRRTK